ncbi:transposase [Nitrospirillum viridazoti Y2]|nr:transposase [Nitrospirillum amazonense Y2]
MFCSRGDMDFSTGEGSVEGRFAAYVEHLASALGHADRVAPFRAYCTGLMLPGERKSVEPMAARVEPGRVGAAHQSLHHFVAKAAWDDAAVLGAVRDLVLPVLQAHGPIRAWIIDDTGMPKKGRHSVGVARQYCGQLGKQDNCQVAVSLSVASDHASLPVAFQLYLPEAWANDPALRAKAGVPEAVTFQTKPPSPWTKSVLLWQRVCPPGWCSWMRATATTPLYGVGSARWASPMSPASNPTSPSGRRVWCRCRPSPGAARGGHQCASAGPPDMNRYRPRPWPPAWRQKRGRPSLGAKAPTPRSPPASPPSASIPPTATTSAPNCGRRSGCSSNGLKTSKSLPNIGCPPCRKRWRCRTWSTPPNCAGASSATTLNLNRNSASATMRAGDGADSTTTPPSASPPMDSCSENGPRFPPQLLLKPGASRRLTFPKLTDPGAPPPRPERHVPTSIATMRITIARALAKTLPRCPCCYQMRQLMTQ